jgi:tetratricopeptide (TPR) repeat protein
VLLACVALGRPAHADDVAAARLAYEEGRRHYDLADYAEALAAFKRAYMLLEQPDFLYNIAACHRRLGQRTQALEFYQRYLDKVPNSPDRVAIDRMIAELKAQPASSSETARPAAPEKTVAPPTVEKSAVALVPTAEAEPKPRRHRVWPWIVAGAAVVVAATAIGVAVAVSTGAGVPKSDLGAMHLVFR